MVIQKQYKKIYFIGNLDEHKNITIFFIIEDEKKEEETISDILQGTVRVL